MEAGAENPNRGTVLVPAGMNEAWRGFWSHGTNSRAYTRVALQGWWRADNKSWCTKLKMTTGAVSRYKLPPKPEICQVTQSTIESSGAESGWCYLRVML